MAENQCFAIVFLSKFMAFHIHGLNSVFNVTEYRAAFRSIAKLSVVNTPFHVHSSSSIPIITDLKIKLKS